jgi:ribonuclease P protein component
VAYAIGRSCGPAVTRNRLRRRLRTIVREFDRQQPLPSGLLLIGAEPTAIELTFDQLQQQAQELLRTLGPHLDQAAS